MRTHRESDLRTLGASKAPADRDEVARIRPDDVNYYIDVARQMRAEAIADLFRKARASLARALHLTPATRGATPRTV